MRSTRSTRFDSEGPWRLIPRDSHKPRIYTRKADVDLQDLFHHVIHMRARRIIVFFTVAYVSLVIFFAFAYLIVDHVHSCNAGLEGMFQRALYFSLETHATIGYGVPDSNFNECSSLLVVLFLQVLTSLIGDSVLAGVVLAKVTSGLTRKASMVYSETALLVEHEGELCLVFQLFDPRRDLLVDANVRAFVYVHRRVDDLLFPHHRALKLDHPSPDDGSALMLCAPTLAIHRLTEASPIMAAATMALSAQDEAQGELHAIKAFSPSELLTTLESLAHFEIVVEVNGIEGVTTSQVQARWSYVLDEIVEADDHEMPSSQLIDGKRSYVERTAVQTWKNTESAPRGQLGLAVAFCLRKSS